MWDFASVTKSLSQFLGGAWDEAVDIGLVVIGSVRSQKYLIMIIFYHNLPPKNNNKDKNMQVVARKIYIFLSGLVWLMFHYFDHYIWYLS